MNNKMTKTILIVEDEIHLARAEAYAVNNFGYEVIISHTGEEAVRTFVKNESIDLILMDIELGKGIDGTEAARRILKHRYVPIIFLTSHTEKEYVDKVRELNRYGYITKNSGIFVLQSSIEMALELFEAKKTISKKHDILQKTEERERERIRELESVLDAVPAIVWIANDPECKAVTGNRLANEFIKMPSDSNQSKTATFDEKTRNFTVWKDGKKIPDEELPVQLAARGIVIRDFEQDVVFDDGSTYHLIGNANPLFNNRGKVYGSVAAFNDISKNKKNEENLRVTNEKFSKAFYSSPNPATISNLKNGQFMEVNDSFLNMIGFSREEIQGKSCFELDIISKDFWDNMVKTLGEQGRLHDLEIKLRKKTGELIWVLTSLEVIELEGEKCDFSICKDITDRKLAEEKLKEQLDELRHWHNVTLGREERIIELKSEVNQLLKRLGEPERYGIQEK